MFDFKNIFSTFDGPGSKLNGATIAAMETRNGFDQLVESLENFIEKNGKFSSIKDLINLLYFYHIDYDKLTYAQKKYLQNRFVNLY